MAHAAAGLESCFELVYIVWLCLAAIFFTYINIGGYWTYIELAAEDAAIADELISRLLVWGSLCSVVGCRWRFL